MFGGARETLTKDLPNFTKYLRIQIFLLLGNSFVFIRDKPL